ncbi:MFS transporter [Spirillospora sp. NPDC000708]
MPQTFRRGGRQRGHHDRAVVLLSGLGCALQAHLDAGSGASSITLGLIVTGAGVGLMLPAMGAAVLTAAPPDRRGTAAGAMTTFRQLGQTLGVAALATTALNRPRPKAPQAEEASKADIAG